MPATQSLPVTGSSSGLGLDITRDVLLKGDIAVATLRKPEVLDDLAEQYPKERLLVLKVDVTVHQDILDAFKKAKEAFGRIDVVVSNAGTALLSEVEGTPDDVARALFEVNFWGSTHVLQEALTIISLGAFGTNAVGAMTKLPVHPAYDKPDLVVSQSRKAILTSLTGNFDPMYEVKGDAAKAADAIYRMSVLPSPPLRVPLGCVGLARAAINSFSEEVEEYASWLYRIDR